MLMSTMNNEVVSANKVITDSITMGDITTSGISHQLNQKSANIYNLITEGFLDSALRDIKQLLTRLDPHDTKFNDLSLISLSLTDPYFSDTEDWILNGWNIIDNELYGTGGIENNYCLISNDVYVKPGQYILCVLVNQLTSGRIIITKNDLEISDIKTTGTHFIEVTVEDIANDKIALKMDGVLANSKVEIFSISIHYIAERFYQYILNKTNNVSQGLSEFLTSNYVSKAEIEDCINTQFNELIHSSAFEEVINNLIDAYVPTVSPEPK